jgi:pyruvate/2-oxoglutarate dehydrogenase complex dihydrolipoamide dehydrogenase (E3) component
VTYTDPEIAHVGMYEHEAQAQGIAVDTFVQELSEVDRAITDGEDTGFVKVHVKKGSDKIVGATIVARNAGEMINEFTLAMVAGVGMSTLANVIHPYPTQSEAVRKVANAYTRTRFTPTLQKLFKWWIKLTA